MGLTKYTQGMHTKENPAEEKASKKKEQQIQVHLYICQCTHLNSSGKDFEQIKNIMSPQENHAVSLWPCSCSCV